MKIELRQEVRRSWFDPVGSKALSCRTADRLHQRCQGEHGLFVTLTYAREDWADARDCFRDASDRRHVRRFMQRLGEWVWWRMPAESRPYTPEGNPANPLNAQWICKMEFQRDGFVHWHLLILGINYIPNDVVANCWGFGFTKVARMTRRRVRYLTKYVGKAGDLPAWLYLEPSRSVKFIRASPGFWRDTDPHQRERVPRQRVTGYETIGQACHRAQSRTQVINSNHHRRVLKCTVEHAARIAWTLGFKLVPGRAHWFTFERPRFCPARRRAAEGGPPSGFNLTDTPNPPPRSCQIRPGWFIQALRSASDNPLDHG